MSALSHLRYRSGLSEFQAQADQLLEGWWAGDPQATDLFRKHHPKFLDAHIRWLPRKMSGAEVRAVPISRADAQLVIARWYGFADWSKLAEWVKEVTLDGSEVCRFESAVEAVISGDEADLNELLQQHPDLVRARSTRVTPHDPPQHKATLLHYLAANGVEEHRQRSPQNAVQIARMLLRAGSKPDALADMYGGQQTTMSMLVSSCPPAQAGVQVGLVNVLADFGASVEACGTGGSPLMTALAFGHPRVAEALVRRGARVDTLACAAGLGRLDDARRMLKDANSQDRHRALALGAQLGHAEIVRMLLAAGEDPNRYNPEGNHGHSTPLHQAVASGHENVVRLLVERGARLDIKDAIWEGTPLGWAEHCGRHEIAEYLSRIGEHGAP